MRSTSLKGYVENVLRHEDEACGVPERQQGWNECDYQLNTSSEGVNGMDKLTGMNTEIEILAGNMDKYFERLEIKAQKKWEGQVYGGSVYQVWALDKSEFEKLANTPDESYQPEEWWRSAEGSNMGTADVPYIISGKKINAWDGARREDYDEEEEELFEREYGRLTEYFCDEIGSSQPRNVCALAVDLAKQNGLTLADLFKRYETGKVDKNHKYYLCDFCKDTDNPDDDAIYNCKKCGRQICNACVINLEVGEEIPCDDQQNIDSQYCPYCGVENES